jgi:TonB family protein
MKPKFLSLVALLVLSSALVAQDNKASPKPSAKGQVSHLQDAGMDELRLGEVVLLRGMDLEPTDEFLDTLEIVGAGEALPKSLRRIKPIRVLPSQEPILTSQQKSEERNKGAEAPKKGVYHVDEGSSAPYPIPIFKPEPPYTKKARKAKLEGTVMLVITVDAKGNVTHARVVKRLGMGLDKSALKTVKTWEFRPATRDGIAVPVRVGVEIPFNLSRPDTPQQ